MNDLQRLSCGISVDMDEIHVYYANRGIEPAAGCDTGAVYTKALPRILDLFAEFGVTATFFITGSDARRNPAAVKRIAAAGHEIGNHTLTHPAQFADMDGDRKRREITEADRVLRDVIGTAVVGYRAPGWSLDRTTMDILAGLEYVYDASVFPSRLLMGIALANRVLSRGKMTAAWDPRMGRAPKQPYRTDAGDFWKRGDGGIIEVPLSVLPLLQLPYLMSLGYMLGRPYLKTGLAWLNAWKAPLSFICHGIELVDYTESINDPALSGKPGLTMPLRRKTALYRTMLAAFGKRHRFVPLRELAGCAGTVRGRTE